jgi:hypothetical protein
MGNVVDLIHGFLNVYLNKGSCVVVFVHFHLELLTVVVLAMLLDLLSCVYCILIIYNPKGGMCPMVVISIIVSVVRKHVE